MTDIVVFDTETSGLSDTDQIVEMATIRTRAPECRVTTDALSQWLVRPDVPISSGARAAHHITDAALQDAPSRLAWLVDNPDPLRQLEALPPTVVAHNLEFDLRLLRQTGVPDSCLPAPDRQLCTYRCSVHLWPDAENHRNISLWYEKGLDTKNTVNEKIMEMRAHRALFDATITTDLLRLMLTTHSVSQLVELTQRPALLTRVRFGKYRGRPWSEMDEGFLRWILSPGRSFGPDVLHTAQHHLDNRRSAR